jgi:hypothetical protein
MQVQDIQCQIAQTQIGRYLGGEAFDAETLRQLNEHISGCSKCKEFVNSRRAEVTAEELAAEAPSWRERLADMFRQHSKPILYTAALATILVAMGFLSNDPTTIFGQRATAATQVQPTGAEKQAETAALRTPTQETQLIDKAEEGNEPLQVQVGSLAPTNSRNPKSFGGPVGSIDASGQPTVTVYPPTSAIAKAVDKPSANKPQTTTHRSKPRTQKRFTNKAPRPSPRIVIYDPQGNVINP